MIRLQKYLASCGVASRRSAEKMIAEGRIAVNGVVITEMGIQVDPDADTVTVDGVRVLPEAEKHYIAYNKPVGEVTTVSDPEGRATVLDRFRDYPVRLFPVGRLDYAFVCRIRNGHCFRAPFYQNPEYTDNEQKTVCIHVVEI